MGSSQSIHDETSNNNRNSKDITYNVGDMLKTFPENSFQFSPRQKIQLEPLSTVEGGFVLHNVLSKNECTQLIQLAEQMEFSQSPLRDLTQVNSEKANLSEQTLQIRNSERVLCDAPKEILEEFCDRIISYLPQTVDCLQAKWQIIPTGDEITGGCINKRWRFNRYPKGGYFKPHFDAGYRYSADCMTLLTIIFYLNDDFKGGETTFFPGNKKYSHSKPEDNLECVVKPRVGSALVFFQAGNLSPRHEGSELLSDTPKYILRSDVAYKRICETENL